MMTLRSTALWVSVLFLFACTSAESPSSELAQKSAENQELETPQRVETEQPAQAEVDTPAATTEPVQEAIPKDPVHVGLTAEAQVDLQPQPPAPEPFIRTRRRMTVDQLDASIRAVTGGFTWVKGQKNQLEQLAATLGRPDYITRVNEDLEPGPVFTKFLKDAAYAVCGDLKAHELEVPAEERILMVHVSPEDTMESHPEAVDANLRMLLLRFHGHYPDVDAPELKPWRWLFQSVTHLSDEPADGWRAVCVALIAHPNFCSY